VSELRWEMLHLGYETVAARIVKASLGDREVAFDVMRHKKKTNLRSLSVAIISGLLISTTPSLYGCSRSPHPSTSTQASSTTSAPIPPPSKPIPSPFASPANTAQMVPGPPPRRGQRGRIAGTRFTNRNLS
jgi:hypothetical protein